jgi:hypothetical protein
MGTNMGRTGLQAGGCSNTSTFTSRNDLGCEENRGLPGPFYAWKTSLATSVSPGDEKQITLTPLILL